MKKHLCRDHRIRCSPETKFTFIADTDHVERALATFGHEEQQDSTRRITIIGGGNIGLNLAKYVEEMENITGRIIEHDTARARRIVSILHDTQVTQGDALDNEILEETNIQNADTVVAVSNDDETNILASLLAKDTALTGQLRL